MIEYYIDRLSNVPSRIAEMPLMIHKFLAITIEALLHPRESQRIAKNRKESQRIAKDRREFQRIPGTERCFPLLINESHKIELISLISPKEIFYI